MCNPGAIRGCRVCEEGGNALYERPSAILTLFRGDLVRSQHVEVDPRTLDPHSTPDQLPRSPAKDQANVEPPASAPITT